MLETEGVTEAKTAQAEPAAEPATAQNPTDPAPSTDPVNEQPDGMGSLLGGESEPVDGVPEAYEAFEGENGQKFSPEQVSGFVDAAKELGLTQEKAQKLFSAMAPTARAYMQDGLVKQAKQWEQASMADPEFGGDNFKRNQAVIREAYLAYTTPELRQIINGSGLGCHPEVLRMFYRIGQTMQQDKGVAGSASAPAAKRSRYPKSNMVID